MKKKFITLAVLLIFVLAATLTACTTNKNDRITVAKIDGKKVTKTEFIKSWDNVKSNYGITQEVLDNPDYAADLDDFRKSVLEEIVIQKVSKIELENLGYYDLSETEHETIKTQVESFKQNILAEYESEISAELGSAPTEKDYTKTILKYTQLAFDNLGVDEEYVKDYYTYILVSEKARLELVDLIVTDEDVMSIYNERIDAEKEYFTDLSAYGSYIAQGGQPYYTPEGIRLVRHVLILYDEDSLAGIREARSNGNDEEADKLVKAAQESIKEEATDVLTQLQDGTITFDTAILNYNEDPGMETNPEGYQVYEGTTDYVPEFTEGAMALKAVGDISELVGTDFGYHILEYTSDVESSTIDFEVVKASLIAEYSETKREEGWQAQLEEWVTLHEVEYFLENLAEEKVIPKANEPQ